MYLLLNQKTLVMGLMLTAGLTVPYQAMATTDTNGVTDVQQAKRVTGRVSDSMGSLIGATVMEKGTSNGTVTDLNGHFNLNVKPEVSGQATASAAASEIWRSNSVYRRCRGNVLYTRSNCHDARLLCGKCRGVETKRLFLGRKQIETIMVWPFGNF